MLINHFFDQDGTMKALLVTSLLLVSQLSVAGEKFQNFKQLYLDSIAPRSVEEVKAQIEAVSTCLSYSENEDSSSVKLENKILTLREGSGPAFPAVTVDGIFLGDPLGHKLEGFKFKTSLDADALTVETMKTLSNESCTDFGWVEDIYFGVICSQDFQSQSLVKLKIKLNGNYVVFKDETAKTFGYCW
jgi:hypothetical protein